MAVVFENSRCHADQVQTKMDSCNHADHNDSHCSYVHTAGDLTRSQFSAARELKFTAVVSGRIDVVAGADDDAWSRRRAGRVLSVVKTAACG